MKLRNNCKARDTATLVVVFLPSSSSPLPHPRRNLHHISYQVLSTLLLRARLLDHFPSTFAFDSLRMLDQW